MKEMPEIEGSGFCISVLQSIGYFAMGYASIEPISWAEINSYQSATGVKLTAWEAETVRILSENYVAQSRISTEENCIPPYTPEMTPDLRKAQSLWLKEKMKD